MHSGVLKLHPKRPSRIREEPKDERGHAAEYQSCLERSALRADGLECKRPHVSTPVLALQHYNSCIVER